MDASRPRLSRREIAYHAWLTLLTTIMLMSVPVLLAIYVGTLASVSPFWRWVGFLPYLATGFYVFTIYYGHVTDKTRDKKAKTSVTAIPSSEAKLQGAHGGSMGASGEDAQARRDHRESQ